MGLSWFMYRRPPAGVFELWWRVGAKRNGAGRRRYERQSQKSRRDAGGTKDKGYGFGAGGAVVSNCVASDCVTGSVADAGLAAGSLAGAGLGVELGAAASTNGAALSCGCCCGACARNGRGTL